MVADLDFLQLASLEQSLHITRSYSVITSIAFVAIRTLHKSYTDTNRHLLRISAREFTPPPLSLPSPASPSTSMRVAAVHGAHCRGPSSKNVVTGVQAAPCLGASEGKCIAPRSESGIRDGKLGNPNSTMTTSTNAPKSASAELPSITMRKREPAIAPVKQSREKSRPGQAARPQSTGNCCVLKLKFLAIQVD